MASACMFFAVSPMPSSRYGWGMTMIPALFFAKSTMSSMVDGYGGSSSTPSMVMWPCWVVTSIPGMMRMSSYMVASFWACWYPWRVSWSVMATPLMVGWA